MASIAIVAPDASLGAALDRRNRVGPVRLLGRTSDPDSEVFRQGFEFKSEVHRGGGITEHKAHIDGRGIIVLDLPKRRKQPENPERDTELTIVELTTTIKLNDEIAQELGVSATKVSRLSAKHRPKLVSDSVFSGLDHEKLEIPFKQLTADEKADLVRRNAAHIDEMFLEFKGKPAEAPIRERVLKQIGMALDKYHPDMMSEQHFVQLVAKRVIINHSRENLRAAGFKAQNHSRKKKEYIEKNYPDEACDFLEQALPRLMQLTEARVSFEEARDDIMQDAALRILQNFRPDIELKGEFVVQQVDAAAHRYFATEKTEQIKAFGFYMSLISETPELQNRPRPKSSLNDRFNGYRELMRA